MPPWDRSRAPPPSTTTARQAHSPIQGRNLRLGFTVPARALMRARSSGEARRASTWTR